ncbi:membrane protein YqaA, SNARE-associated domain [Mariprofundus ferrinatatus]|uniref:Membrane protein YqaA, SNARE-associated domain n=1 Tax=Mariprofundus ferrinatatus TaxID=1921087 RepID=A0A2K8L190_9PROT|nr:YqaA family protein [Mariprofundus ferrinatatus]ATX81085.1 membrane protein YqaA, SNARE-associated domain [Mariprofundus ferrinatatus]
MDWSLFFSALISSTLFPGGSEVLLLYRLNEGGNAVALVLIATAGNVLGSLITYGMGRLGNEAVHKKWLRISESQTERAELWFGKYGRPSLLFAWLPVIGDPLCLVAGLLRCSLITFVVLVSIGKLARYAVLAAPFV